MNMRIIGLYPQGNQVKTVDIFGYTTKGLPGLEIVGLGRFSRPLKEKFVYLTQLQQMRTSRKRYLLCVEHDEKPNENLSDNYRWLELPLLILFWSLSGQLPIRNLNECISSGKVSISGNILPLSLNQNILTGFKMTNVFKFIVSEENAVPDSILHITLEDLFHNKRGISFSK